MFLWESSFLGWGNYSRRDRRSRYGHFCTREFLIFIQGSEGGRVLWGGCPCRQFGRGRLRTGSTHRCPDYRDDTRHLKHGRLRRSLLGDPLTRHVALFGFWFPVSVRP